jgi:hypothetical protein
VLATLGEEYSAYLDHMLIIFTNKYLNAHITNVYVCVLYFFELNDFKLA